jgi:hypothetical protein
MSGPIFSARGAVQPPEFNLLPESFSGIQFISLSDLQYFVILALICWVPGW